MNSVKSNSNQSQKDKFDSNLININCHKSLTMTRTGTQNFEDLQMNYCLGSGQHASVHLVKDRSGNSYAMKVSHGVGRSLEKEFHIYCALSGTTPPVPPPSRPAPPYGIARVYGYESLDDHSRFLMQLLGPSLDSITEIHGPYGAEQVLDIGQTVLRILRIVHQKNIVHGDIAPRNICQALPDNSSRAAGSSSTQKGNARVTAASKPQLFLVDFSIGTIFNRQGRPLRFGENPPAIERSFKQLCVNDINLLMDTLVELAGLEETRGEKDFEKTVVGERTGDVRAYLNGITDDETIDYDMVNDCLSGRFAVQE